MKFGKFTYMRKINKHYKEIKTAIRKHKLADHYFVIKYSFSPYMACEHGCIYCDGRAEKYYVEGDYEKDIVIRKNLPEVLERELSKLREKGVIFIGSGISDSYQPVEKDEKLMRKCAEILYESDFAVTVLTKSSLILRDLNIWKKVHQKNGFVLMISLTFLDDELRKIFEAGASSVQERIDTLKIFKSEGIPVGIAAMPFLPFINDSEKQISDFLNIMKEIDVDFIMPASLTLRPGKQKETYMKIIDKYFPELTSKYENLYQKNLQSGMPLYSYRNRFYHLINRKILERNIPIFQPHFIFKNKFPLYDEIHILMNHLCELYKNRNVDIAPLKISLNKYFEWLLDEKTFFNRRRKLTYKDLEAKLIEIIKSEEFLQIIKNRKLFEFLKKIVIDRKTFDYGNLKIVD